MVLRFAAGLGEELGLLSSRWQRPIGHVHVDSHGRAGTSGLRGMRKSRDRGRVPAEHVRHKTRGTSTLAKAKARPPVSEKRAAKNSQPLMSRYDNMTFRRCGRSGLHLPLISLGLWHNFGDVDDYGNARSMVLHAFERGITHFDLANNYGPSPGSAETTFGKILREDLRAHRDELIISSKAGYRMWPGPYGEWGSRKYLIASADQSLQRMGLEYVDIFYSHRYDPRTPLEETMGALAHLVNSGKALYAGISNYGPEEAREAARILLDMGTPCLIHQPKYSMFERSIETGLLDALEEEGIGCIPYSPLAQGMLTNKYLNGIPADSRAGKEHGFLHPDELTEHRLRQIRELNDLASERHQSLACMAVQWVLRNSGITSALIGASRTAHIDDALAVMESGPLTEEELARIETILSPAR